MWQDGLFTVSERLFFKILLKKSEFKTEKRSTIKSIDYQEKKHILRTHRGVFFSLGKEKK